MDVSLRIPVTTCTGHRDKAFPHRHDLENMAYIIDLKKKIGFETTVKVHVPGSDEHRKIVNPHYQDRGHPDEQQDG